MENRRALKRKGKLVNVIYAYDKYMNSTLYLTVT